MRTNHRACLMLVGFALFFVALLPWCPRQVLSAEDETLETIVAVWRKREETIKSVQFVIAEDCTIGKGSHARGQPPEDFESKKQVVLVLEGENMRHEREGETWGMGAPVHMAWSAVHEGERSKVVSVTPHESIGTVDNKPKHMDVRSAALGPALWHFRPLSAKFSVFQLDALQIISRKEMINGSRCILLEQPTTVAGRVWRFWISPDKEMAVVRAAIVQGGIERRKWDVSFHKDPKHGWLPTKWKTVAIKDGAIFSAGSIVVTKYDVNGDVPPGTFDIQFPPGTRVFDRIARQTYRVKPDGSKHVLESSPPLPARPKGDKGKPAAQQ